MNSKRKKRMLVIHHGDPIAYPPLMHALKQLSDSGYQISLLGCLPDPERPLIFPENLQVQRRLIPAAPKGASWHSRLGRIVHWFKLIFGAIWLSTKFRPHWIYASDPSSLVMACPARFIVGAHMLYQEHDSIEPNVLNESLARRFQRRLRLRVLQCAQIVVFPNAGRLAVARKQAGMGLGTDLVIWNVAPITEVMQAPIKRQSEVPRARPTLRLHFHGSMSKFRVPMALIDALVLVPEVSFQFASYEIGGYQYTNDLLAYAHSLGISERVINLGTLSTRPALLAATQKADVGLAFFSESPKNVNHYNMAGATNKVFDYLGAGIALLCSNGMQWRADFIPFFGVAADPNDAESIAHALRLLLNRTPDPQKLGRLGQAKIRADWHFEARFQPALEALARLD